MEDVSIQVGQFIILCDFVVLDMLDNPHVSIIIGSSILAIAGAVIHVQADTISFQLCGEMVDFYFPPPTPSLELAILPPPVAPMFTVPPATIYEITIFDGDEGSHMQSLAPSDFSLPIP